MKQTPLTNKATKTLAVCGATILLAACAQADSFWTAGTDTFNNANNWNPTGVPNNVNAIVTNGGTVLMNPGDPDWTTFDVRAGNSGGPQDAGGHYIQNGPNLQCNSWFRIGIGDGSGIGAGDYLLKSGNINSARFIISDNVGALCTFTATNTGTITVPSDEVWCGQYQNGIGTINLGGTVSFSCNNWLAIGRDGATGVINLTGHAVLNKAGGNVITFAGLNTGGNANGTINQSEFSTVNCAANDVWLPENGVGTWNMSGSCTSTIATLSFGQTAGNGPCTGFFNLNGGELNVNQIQVGGGSGTLNFNGGTLRARGANANFMSGASGVITNGGAIIDSAGFDIGISSALSDPPGGTPGSLTKTGNGTLTLSGANTYSGGTIVSAGKLIDTTASLAAGAVTVANNAGYGVALAAPNSQVTRSTLTLSGSAASLSFDTSSFGDGSVAPLSVGSLVNNGTTAINLAGTALTIGQVPLVSYTSLSGAGTFVIGKLPAGVSGTVVNDTVSKLIYVNITSTSLIRWDGEVAGSVWDINTTTNWTDYLLGGPAKFADGAAVFFDDMALGSTTVNLGVSVSPGSITVTNDTLAYAIQGAGSISGATGLTKQGTNTLSISTVNDYTGVTTISGGTLSINSLGNGGTPSSIGAANNSSANLVLNGGTLSYAGPAGSTDRGFTLSGNSTLDLQNDLAYNGNITPILGATLTKTGNGKLSITNSGIHTLSNGGGGSALNVQSGALLLDGSAAGGQTNIVNGELWVGGTVNALNSSVVLSNTTLNLSSWLALSRGSGTGGYTSSVSLFNSKLKSSNGSLCYDNGIPNTLQTALLTLNGTSTYTNNGDSNLSESGGGNAIITLNDSSVFYSQNRMMVGWHNNATAAVTVANSAKIVVNAWMSIGNEGGTGSVLLKDSGSVECGDFNVCDVNTGDGRFYAEDHSHVHAGNMWVGKGNGSTGYLLLTNNATILSDNGLTLGQGVSSFATVDLAENSTLSVNLVQGTPAATSLSSFNFNGGTLIAHPPYFGDNFIYSLEYANVMKGGAKIEIDGTDARHVPQALVDGDGLGGGLTKLGTGTLFLDGLNGYTGTTTVSQGTLGGIGYIIGPVVVQSGANLSPGASVGTLTVNNSLTLNTGSTTIMEIDKTNSLNDQIVGMTTANYGGTLVLRKLNGTLAANDTFTLFGANAYNGSFSSIVSETPGQTVTWNTSQLGVNGTVSVASAVATPVTISAVVNANSLTLSWPAAQTEWTLQTQTSPLNVGLTGNWVDVAGSSSTNQITIPIDSTQGSVFYRLVY